MQCIASSLFLVGFAPLVHRNITLHQRCNWDWCWTPKVCNEVTSETVWTWFHQGLRFAIRCTTDRRQLHLWCYKAAKRKQLTRFSAAVCIFSTPFSEAYSFGVLQRSETVWGLLCIFGAFRFTRCIPKEGLHLIESSMCTCNIEDVTPHLVKRLES